ncbi:hypothetical protein BDW74DRAFT_180075 [Aspergillus multicolor]|uniref:uncharacterized protein n=1 Tax=Aspergillus multicolor TaxID=41759 RepID=UPI003CCDE664
MSYTRNLSRPVIFHPTPRPSHSSNGSSHLRYHNSRSSYPSDGSAQLRQGQGTPSQSRPYNPNHRSSHPPIGSVQLRNNNNQGQGRHQGARPRNQNPNPRNQNQIQTGPTPIRVNIPKNLDLDNDTTMSGMPSPYTTAQWRLIQKERYRREFERLTQLQLQQQQMNTHTPSQTGPTDLDTVMTDAPALELAPPRPARSAFKFQNIRVRRSPPRGARHVQFELNMADV